MIRRSGVTLIEVLIAIFVSAIGLLALLALFPLGALSMAQAIKDSRCAQAAASATAVAQFQQIRNDSTLSNPDAFVNPNNLLWPDLSGVQNPAYGGPSYPVYVDPFGANNLGLRQLGLYGWLAAPPVPLSGFTSPGIPRRTVSFVKGTPDYLRWFTLLDDVSFQSNGVPDTGTGYVERENRYSWAYLIKRPNYADKSVVSLSVVVYSGRSQIGTTGQLQVGPQQLPVVAGETAYGPVAFGFDPNNLTKPINSVVVVPAAGQSMPALRPGSWVLDATVINPYYIDPVTNTTVPRPDPHGFFYRVANVTDITDPVTGQPAVQIEFQTTPRQATTYVFPGNNPPPPQPYGVLVVMDNVVEVFEK